MNEMSRIRVGDLDKTITLREVLNALDEAIVSTKWDGEWTNDAGKDLNEDQSVVSTRDFELALLARSLFS